jgi:hypothetical protein
MIPKLALVNLLLAAVVVLSAYGLYQRMTTSIRGEISPADLPVSPKRSVSFPNEAETPSNEAVVSILQNNLFRRERQEWRPSPTPTPVGGALAEVSPTPTPTPDVPDPELQLYGVVIIGDQKMAILDGNYSVLEEQMVTVRERIPHVSGAPQYERKNVMKEVAKPVQLKRKQHRLGEVIGQFYIHDIFSDRVILRNIHNEEREVVVLLRDPLKPKEMGAPPSAPPPPAPKPLPASAEKAPESAGLAEPEPTPTHDVHVSGAQTQNP